MSSDRPPRSVINSVLEEDNYTCQNCHRNGRREDITLEVHHMVPLKNGGSNNKSNLHTLCKDCHAAAHTNAQAPTGQSSQPDFLIALRIVHVFVYFAGKRLYTSVGFISIITLIFLAADLIWISFLFLISSGIFIFIMKNGKKEDLEGSEIENWREFKKEYKEQNRK